MTVKRLFKDDDRYSPEATQLVDETHDMVKPLFEKWVQQGYSVRDISYIMQATISGIDGDQVLAKIGWLY
jgi:hypothetical protein